MPSARILTTIAKRLGSEEFLGDYCLVLNFLPTDWCLGLAWLLKVKYVLYLSNSEPKALKTSTDAMGNDGFPAWKLSTWKWACTFNHTTRIFQYDVDSKKYASQSQLNEKASIKAIVDSLESAQVIDKLDFGGVDLTSPPPPVWNFTPKPRDALREDLFVRTAFALVNQTWKQAADGRPPGLSGHNIGVIAVGEDDKIVGWAVNVSEVSRCFHAESLLIQRLLAKGLRPGGQRLRFYATLEPCQMCAGMFTTLWPGAEVIYGMADDKIVNNSLARKRNGCIQRLATTCVNQDETIPSLLAKLKTQTGFNTTGFLDAPNAARRVFSGAQDKVSAVPNLIRGLDQKLAAVDNLPPDRRRQMVALLNVRSGIPRQNDRPNIAGLDLARPLQQPKLLWVGVNWKMHFPFILYLDDFLRQCSLSKPR
jgi:tRNA(Arg) A34 adenosine deaminase TadA